MKTQLEEFKEFAESRLQNHLEELSTKYDRRSMDKDLIDQAHADHKRIFREELDSKLREVSPSDNPWLTGELSGLKKEYEERLDR